MRDDERCGKRCAKVVSIPSIRPAESHATLSRSASGDPVLDGLLARLRRAAVDSLEGEEVWSEQAREVQRGAYCRSGCSSAGQPAVRTSTWREPLLDVSNRCIPQGSKMARGRWRTQAPHSTGEPAREQSTRLCKTARATRASEQASRTSSSIASACSHQPMATRRAHAAETHGRSDTMEAPGAEGQREHLQRENRDSNDRDREAAIRIMCLDILSVPRLQFVRQVCVCVCV